MNHQRSQIALCKWLFQHSFHPSPKLFSLNSLSTSPTRRVSDPAPLPEPEILLNTPTTAPHHFLHPALSNSPTQFAARRNVRQFSGGPEEFDQNQVVDTINLKFAEAREEIEMAMESKETVYFDEEAECARDSVKKCWNCMKVYWLRCRRAIRRRCRGRWGSRLSSSRLSFNS